jgi:RHS repeat-associated protein
MTTLSCIPGKNGFVLTNSYLLGLNGEQVSETDAKGNWLHTNVFANGGLLATYRDTNTYFALNDWLGNKRAQYSAAGGLTTYATLPFGDNLTSAGSGPDATEHHFTGKERDTETGLDYFGARFLNSNMGRWMSPDWSASAEPVPYASPANPQSLNLYAYVQNNPLSKRDLDGHDWVYDYLTRHTSDTQLNAFNGLMALQAERAQQQGQSHQVTITYDKGVPLQRHSCRYQPSQRGASHHIRD